MAKPRASAECEINASIEKVWQILIDVAKYGEWNPFIIGVESSSPVPEAGTGMRLTVQFQNQQKPTTPFETVLEFRPPHPSAENDGRKTAVWVYKFDDWLARLGLIRGSRVQRLTELADGRTHYFTEEVFSGLAASFVPLPDVQAGFEAQAQALRITAEQS